MLLEREQLLERLSSLYAHARRGGRLALVTGEAGIGKTTLVDAFCERENVSPLWGSCDAVAPARPFAPLGDIAEVVDPSLRRALDGEDRNRVFEEFLALVRQPRPQPRVVVVDDLHWADDSTLDLLRVVGRRLRDLPVLIVGTFRDDEVSGEHPLRLALGDVPPDAVVELPVPPLSLDAVATLGRDTPLDPIDVHRATSGNPFFVTEVIAAGGHVVPRAVADAVAARVARLSPAGREVLQAASILGDRFDRVTLIEIGGDAGAVGECLDHALLRAEGDGLRFRHELAQRAVRDALTDSERSALHARALLALRRAGADAAGLVHHAVGAGNADAVVELAPAAAAKAAALGAHREAAAHYETALRWGSSLDARARAELLESHAHERLVVDDVDGALASQEQALRRRREVGDAADEARCLRELSLMQWVAGDGDGAVESADRAVELLESAGASEVELARAYASVAQRRFTRGDDTAIALAQRAYVLAEHAGDELAAVHSLTTIGVAESLLGDDDGWRKLEESVRRAKTAGLTEEASRALINIIEAARDVRRYDIVDRYRDDAIGHLDELDPDHDLHRRRLLSVLAEVAVDRGRWNEAERLAAGLLEEHRSASLIRVKALTVLGRLRARRGQRDAWSLLEQALEVAGPHREAQDLCPLYAARAEAAGLAEDLARSRREAERGLALAIALDHAPWWRGELALLAANAGRRGPLPKGCARPYVLEAAGRRRDAAEAWAAIGCPYDRALALAGGQDEEGLRAALDAFHALGAAPMAKRVAARLKSAGAPRVPRGPRTATRSNPAGLTSRELDVLTLLGAGMRNSEIAEALVLSPKTVDHHVSAVLKKLGVPNRAAAAEEAARLGLKDRELAGAE